MKFCTNDPEFGKLLVADCNTGFVSAWVERGANCQSGLGSCARDRFTMTSYVVSRRPRQFLVMKQHSRCSILFHLLVPGGK
jgi:hypothetical protein